MKTIYLVDLDATVVVPGTHHLMCGVKAKLDAIAARPGAEIWFFSCWAFTQEDLKFLKEQFPYHKGFIKKPFGNRYVMIDDKLEVGECAVAL
jgi:hypothetical protein